MSDAERKTETVNLRLSPRMKELLRIAAEREHRTISNMIEALVLDFCARRGITVTQGEGTSRAPQRSVAQQEGE